MSAEALPITASQFAMAIQDLPVENLYSKAHELTNSITHLEGSNKQLQEYSDSMRDDTSLPESTRHEGDKDCLEAIQENLAVIARQKERIALLRSEVERRGGRWHEGAGEETNGHDAAESAEQAASTTATATNGAPAAPATGGRMTDEQLNQGLLDLLGHDSSPEEDDANHGMHL